ncbi:MAG: hypothetical protein ACRD19_17020 [Terriglobia bacterium]
MPDEEKKKPSPEPDHPASPPEKPRPKVPFVPPPLISEPDTAVEELWKPGLPLRDREEVS